jgi:hypothetical protein
MSTKTDTGTIEAEAQDAVATRTPDHKRVKSLFGEADNLKDEVSVELKIYIELEGEEIFARSTILDSDLMTARLSEDTCPSHDLGDGPGATTLN